MKDFKEILLDSVAMAYLAAGGTVIIEELGVVIKPGGGLRKIQRRVQTRIDGGIYRQGVIVNAPAMEREDT